MKLKLLLTLLSTTSMIFCSHVRSLEASSPSLDNQFFLVVEKEKLEYYALQYNKLLRANTPAMSDEQRCAWANYLFATQCLIEESNTTAAALLKEAACEIDIAKVLLAYCYNYGIGIECNKTAAKILVDLAVTTEEDHAEAWLQIRNLFTVVRLGLP